MARFYYFKNDGMCKFMQSVLGKNFPQYLCKPNTLDGKEYYIILDWNELNTTHIKKVLDDYGIRYVKSIDELPEKAGVYITSYDGDREDVKKLVERDVPIKEDVCPWIKKLRIALENSDPRFQYVIIIKDYHIVAQNFKSIIPSDAIILDIDNYKDKLTQERNEKPVYLISYATMRLEDFETISDYLKTQYPHQENVFDHAPICGWIKSQGLLEEVAQGIAEKKLEYVWVISNGPRDTSTISLLKQIKENGAIPVLIQNKEDIPQDVEKEARIGCAITPVPFSNAQKLKEYIKSLYPENL